MDEHIDQPVVAHDPRRLLHLEVHRIVAQDLPHRVVLNEGDRQLNEVPEEEGEDRAAAAGLGFEGIGVRERAVVQAAELGHPVCVAVVAGDRNPTALHSSR